jgi:hypothetical protein
MDAGELDAANAILAMKKGYAQTSGLRKVSFPSGLHAKMKSDRLKQFIRFRHRYCKIARYS